jgi:hypothetical protein
MINSTEMLTIGFELEHCVDESNSEGNHVSVTKVLVWSSPPPPQKFLARVSKAQDAVSKCTSRKLAEFYRAQSRRAVGTIIAREEAANWSCSEDRAACSVSDLLIMNTI